MITSNHFTDKDGRPAGGTTCGEGFTIGWQNGPLVVEGERVPQNGAFVEDVIRAAMDRIEHYQTTAFRSDYNERALNSLAEALGHLRARTKDRQARGVEGTHQE